MTAARPGVIGYARLSVAAALLTIALKSAADLLTGSVGMLSDALESGVNLVAALFALAMLVVAAWPADERHGYGHYKAEYFAGAVEGALILAAAAATVAAAAPRLYAPRTLEHAELGLGIAVVAALVNLAVARVLLGAARRHGSVALEADGHHLMADVWTSAAVVAGVGAVALTGWAALDPLVALVVSANVAWTGVRLLRRSVLGLMDTGLSAGEAAAVRAALAPFEERGVGFHAVRTREAGAHRFVSLHVLVPGAWTIRRGHALLEEIEAAVRAALPSATVFTHIEPAEDSRAWADVGLHPGPAGRAEERPPARIGGAPPAV